MENRRIKILAIDDNPDNLVSLKALIKESFPDASFFSATNGMKGIELAIINNPDVILLDIVMPEMDGFEVCKKLKVTEVLNDIPVVFITALKGDTLSRLHALEAGAEAFLAKPIDEYELTAQIKAMVKIKDANIDKRDRVKILTKLVDEKTRELNESNKSYLNLCEDLHEENEARKKSEDTYRMLFESINDAVFISEKTSDGRISRLLRVNKVACERLGYTEQELLAKTTFEINSERMKPLLPVLLKDLFENKRAIFETEHVTKDGRIIPVEISSNVFQLDGKTIFHSIARDITERKKAEEALSEAYQFTRQITQGADDGIIVYDHNMNYLVWNSFMEKLSGIPAAEVIGKSPVNLFPWIADSNFIEKFEKALSGEVIRVTDVPFNFSVSGRSGWVSDTKSPMYNASGKIIGVITIIRDITKKKIIEQDLQQERNRLAGIIEGTNAGTWEWNVQTGETNVNERWAEIIGYTLNELAPITIGTWIKFCHPEDLEAGNVLIKKHFKGETGYYEYESRIRHKNGCWIWVLERGKVTYRSEDGRALIMQGTHMDITERKLAEQNLKLSESRLKAAQTVAKIGSWETDLSNFNVIWSEETFRIFEIDPYGFQTTHPDFMKFVHPDDQAKVDAAFKESFNKQALNSIEHRIITVTGAEKSVEEYWQIINDDKGKPLKAIGTCQDITDRKKAEEALKASEQNLIRGELTAKFGYWNWNLGDELFHASVGAQEIYGVYKPVISHAELKAQRIPEYSAMIDKAYSSLVKDGKPIDIEYKIRRFNDGEIIDIHSKVEFNPETKNFFGVIQDITNRKQIEEDLIDSEYFFKESQGAASIGSYKLDFATGFWKSSEILDRLFGIEQNYNKSVEGWLDLVYPEDKEMMNQHFLEDVISKRNSFDKEYRISSKADGAVRWVHGMGKLSIDSNGNILTMAGTIQDITGRKMAEEELKEINSKYQFIVENSEDILWTMNPDFTFDYVSPSVYKFLGYTVEEHLKQSLDDFMTPESVKLITDEFRIGMMNLQKKDYHKLRNEACIEIDVIRKDKTIRNAIISLSIVRDGNYQIKKIRGMTSDITERKKREKAQSFSNKLLIILNSNLSFKGMIDAVLYSIREEMKYSAVGMRIKIADDFPYFAETGFSKSFLLKENSLIGRDSKGSICKDEKGNPKLECTCGLVVSDKTDPTNPLFTNAGSFWTNNSYPLLELTPGQEPRFQPRNTCMRFGYGSIAIIPIRANGDIIGTLQLNDKKENAFTIEIIHFFESVSLNIGNTLMRNLEKEKRKIAEEELKGHAEELVSKNTQLTDFCNIISHNLRGPLVNISMLIDFMEESTNQEEKDEILEKFRPVINTLNENFGELIESLQVKNDVSIKSEKLNVKDCVGKIIEGMQVEIDKYEAHIEMDFNNAPDITFPQKYFKSILYNLLSNSLKYKSPERKPLIKIKTEKSKNIVVLSFTDNGLGIDLKRHEKNLFKIRKVFHDHPDAKGFGLFITKTQVEAMGGKIWVESTPGEGSTFFIEFKNQNV